MLQKILKPSSQYNNVIWLMCKSLFSPWQVLRRARTLSRGWYTRRHRRPGLDRRSHRPTRLTMICYKYNFFYLSYTSGLPWLLTGATLAKRRRKDKENIYVLRNQNTSNFTHSSPHKNTNAEPGRAVSEVCICICCRRIAKIKITNLESI